MGYVDENLMPGESILVRAKLHWGMFVGPSLVTGLGGLLVLFFMLPQLLQAFVPAQDQSLDELTPITLMCCLAPYLLFAALLMGSTAARYLSTEFALTDRRIIAKTGVFRRKSLELLLQKVESIGVSQPLVGRMLGYGTIVVSGTGGTRQSFPSIAEPMRLRNQINARIAGQP